MKLGMKIKRLREDLGISINEFSEMLGKSVPTVYRYEQGNAEALSLDMLIKVCEVLNTNPNNLLEFTSDLNYSNEGDFLVKNIALFEDVNSFLNNEYDKSTMFAILLNEDESKQYLNLEALKVSKGFRSFTNNFKSNDICIVDKTRNVDNGDTCLVKLSKNQKFEIARAVQLKNENFIYINLDGVVVAAENIIGKLIKIISSF